MLQFSSLCVCKSVNSTPSDSPKHENTSYVEEGNLQMQVYVRMNIVLPNERIVSVLPMLAF